MELAVYTHKPSEFDADCIVSGVFDDGQFPPATQALDAACNGALSRLVQTGAINGSLAKTVPVFSPEGLSVRAVLLVGLGAQQKYSAAALRQATAAAAKACATLGLANVLTTLSLTDAPELPVDWALRHSLEAASDAGYDFDECKSKPSKAQRVKKWVACVPGDISDDGAQALLHAQAVAGGVQLAKNLGNRPANICTPRHLAQQAQTLANEHANLEATIVDEDGMQALGMNALLAVSRGSQEPARLVVLEYRGADKDTRPYALVGKGVTFDAGGISLKPAATMDEMKYDMGGAASVLGTLSAVAQMQLPINVVAVMACTENLPDGDAVKPGDIITTMSGQTVEILNTDAEGRLCLCDALWYTKRFEPETVIDIATLTGACIVALGHEAAALFSRDESLANQLLEASAATTDYAWRMPLWETYQSQLDSNFADFANVGGRAAGSVTAACYLSRFTGDFRWAHLDVAGVAWNSGKAKGGTGRPVPLLSQYLINRAQA